MDDIDRAEPAVHFHPENVMPEQFAECAGAPRPLRKLAWAMIEQALLDVASHRGKPGRATADAELWFLSEATDALSFLQCCDVCEVDPRPIRRALPTVTREVVKHRRPGSRSGVALGPITTEMLDAVIESGNGDALGLQADAA